MEEAFPGRLFRVYVRPPSVRHLAERLIGRNNYAERLAVAQDELRRLDAHEYDEKIDLLLTSEGGKVTDCARTIWQEYLRIAHNTEGDR
jgi:hypothetical protein